MNFGDGLSSIGSYFESPDQVLLTGRERPPWEDGCYVSYVQTGRQALNAVSKYFLKEGRNILLVPDFLCDSMLVGFSEKDWKLVSFCIQDNFMIHPEDIFEKISDPNSTVLLGMSYFGNEPSEEYIQAIKKIQKLGVRVIEDETHRVLGDLAEIGDVRIASLRKILPVADGAYIRGDFRVDTELELPHVGWDAMDQKLYGNLNDSKKLFHSADSLFKSWVSPPAKPSLRTREALGLLRYDLLRKQRENNSKYLRNELGDVSQVEILSYAKIPSHLVIRVQNAKLLQERLAKVGVFCPIHWPKSERLKSIAWKEDLLSLPIDHRYNEEDMFRIAEEIRIIFSDGSFTKA